MFKALIFSARKMSRDLKIKEKLSKNLNRRIVQKIEEPENTSQFFNGTQNEKKANTKSQSKKRVDELEPHKKKTAAKNTLKIKKPNPTIKEPSMKSISPNADKISVVEPSLEMVTTKSIQSSRRPVKNKAQETKTEGPSRSKKIKPEIPVKEWQPANWENVLDNIRKMRYKAKAPVDTMGCHECADKNADDKTQRYHKLIALMLSSQTKDEITYNAMLRLRENNLTPETICNMKASVLENILHPVSFYKNKTKFIQQTSKILIEKYKSDIPNNIKELVALPGVGPKMAHICMATAWNEITGIGVDVHVHRISNRIGWLPKPTKDPEQTRLALETWLPKYLWSEVNHLLVGFGQTTCTPVKPKCVDCLNFKVCPSAVKK